MGQSPGRCSARATGSGFGLSWWHEMINIKGVKPGKTYGQLTVLHEVLPKKKTTRMWRCVCTCGVEKTVQGSNLTSGGTTSCGCLWHTGDAVRTHGTSNNGSISGKQYHALFSKKDRLGCSAHEMALWILENPPVQGKHLTAKNPWLKLSPSNAIYRTNEEACNNKKMSMWWFVDGKKYDTSSEAAEAHGVTRSSILRWVKLSKSGCFTEYKYPQTRRVEGIA